MSDKIPSITSQEGQILEYMIRNGSITQWDAANDPNIRCWRLGARIFNLRAMGYDIRTFTVEADGKRYARYYLQKGADNGRQETH